MALSAGLSAVGFVPTSVETTATVHLTKSDAGFTISGIDLSCHVVAGNISKELLASTAEDAKKNCPVSQALAAVPITLTLT
jgi:osmotically inducible protein OsmC